MKFFSGAESEHYLNGVFQRRPAARPVWARSHNVLKARGLTRSGEMIVVRIDRSAHRTRNIASLLVPELNAESYYDSSGYMITETWQADLNTWTGNMFWDNTSYNGWASASCTMNVQQFDYPDILWESGNGTSSPNTPVRTWHGIPCTDEVRIATEINRATWRNSWPIVAGIAWTCSITAEFWMACFLPLAIAALGVQGLAAIQDWVTACGCQYVSEACT